MSDLTAVQKVSWREFITITKPGIIRSNLFAALGGYWLAAKWEIDWLLLIIMLIGTTLVMASACVFNNYWDRDLDDKMERTRGRALPAGRLSPQTVLWYAILLGIVGLAVLCYINLLSGVLGFIGLFFYVVVYTVWLKRRSTWSTSVGGVSGAMPPVIGYCAVSNEIDLAAFLLFALLFLWQPPHFWALGIRRREEYRNAGFPLLPVVKGVKRTKIQMIPYVVLLLPTGILLYTYGYAGMIFLIVSSVMALLWIYICLSGFRTRDEVKWAKRNFIFSINYLMVIMLVLIIDTIK